MSMPGITDLEPKKKNDTEKIPVWSFGRCTSDVTGGNRLQGSMCVDYGMHPLYMPVIRPPIDLPNHITM